MAKKMSRAVTCAFTGHRPKALPWGTDESDPRCLALKRALAEAVERAYDMGFRHFICGMARGADFYCGEAVVALRHDRSDITLEGAVPFPQQSERWRPEDQARYASLLTQCDFETLIQQVHTPQCMHRRNRYMVDHAARLIAVYNGSPEPSGTLDTLNYALSQGLDLDILEV